MTRVAGPAAARWWPAGLLAAVGLGIWWNGGFGPGAGFAFAAAAVVALLLALTAEPAELGRAARSGPAVVLVAAAALGALSALWTVGSVEDALAWSALATGYAAIVVCAAAVARDRRGVELLTGAVVGLALAAGLAGLVALALREEPYALTVAGTWRPAGPFEYPPALALLQVTALPGLIWWGAREQGVRWVAWAGAAVICGAVIGFSESRIAIGCAAPTLATPLAIPGLVGATGRGKVARTVVAAAVACALGLATPAAASSPAQSGAPDPPQRATAGKLTHGRVDLWKAALRTYGERPLAGFGAGSFGTAIADENQGTRFAHDLPLEWMVELGIPGLLLALALYGTSALALVRSSWPAAWLLAPGAAVFLIASLLDWEWHLAGSGAVFAMCLGGSLGSSRR